MSEYPKRLTVDDPAGQKLMDCIYVHERQRLGLSPDLFLPECPVCKERAKVKELCEPVRSLKEIEG